MVAPDEYADVMMSTKQPVPQAWSDAMKLAAKTTAPDLTAWALKDRTGNVILAPWRNGYHAVEQNDDVGMAECHDHSAFVAEMQSYWDACLVRLGEANFALASGEEFARVFNVSYANGDVDRHPHLAQAKEYMRAIRYLFNEIPALKPTPSHLG